MTIRRRTRMLLGMGAMLGFWTTGCHSLPLGDMRPNGLLEVVASSRKRSPSAEILRPRVMGDTVVQSGSAQEKKAAATIAPPIIRTSADEEPMASVVASTWQPLARPGVIEPTGVLDLAQEARPLNAPMPIAKTPLRATNEPEQLAFPRTVEEPLQGHPVSIPLAHGAVPAHVGGHLHHGHVNPHGVPREGAKAPLPPYIIEPPDLLLVQLIGRKQEALPQPLNGSFLVRQDGTISLGVYGTVSVVGQTLDQAKESIAAKLATRLKPRKELDEDGKETGKTIPITDELVVDIEEYASKYCYLIADGGGNGASVVRIPINGGDTVLDAFSKVGGLPPQAAKKKIWVARPDHHHPGGNQLLPVDWCAIAQRGQSETNYQMYNGDRIFVQSDSRIRFNAQLDKTLNPVERLLGVTLLGSATVNSIKRGGNNNNNNNNNNN